MLSAMVRSMVLARPRPDLCSHLLPSSTVVDMRAVLALGEAERLDEAEVERGAWAAAVLERAAGGWAELERAEGCSGLAGGDWLSQASASAIVALMVEVRAGAEAAESISISSVSKEAFWSHASPSATVWAMVVERGEPSTES